MSKQSITLSPAARAVLKLPLTTWLNQVVDGNDYTFMSVATEGGSFYDDCELAAFIAALVNAALTPDTPTRNCHARAECEADCPWADQCDNAALKPENNAELRQAVSP